MKLDDETVPSTTKLADGTSFWYRMADEIARLAELGPPPATKVETGLAPFKPAKSSKVSQLLAHLSGTLISLEHHSLCLLETIPYCAPANCEVATMPSS